MIKSRVRRICVFCSSSGGVDVEFFRVAKEMGAEIARRGCVLVYGGSDAGLMGEMARAACRGKGKVVGIIPQAIHRKAPALDAEHELIVTEDLRHRKTLMEMRSDAFVALPGGFGTLEELMEILTLKQLGYHAKPVVILNAGGFYDTLIRFFEEIFEKKFAKQKYRELYHVSSNVKGIFNYLKSPE